MRYLLSLLFLVFSLATYAQPIRLIVRGDDMGFTHAANEACIESFQNGIMQSAEVMVPTPWFSEAVRMLQEHPGLDVGIHLTLTSEWENLKWRPLTTVPSLIDSAGYFYPMIRPNDHYGAAYALREQDWQLAEIEQELRAQIERAQAAIPRLSHITAHMGCTDLDPPVTELVQQLAEEYGLYLAPPAVKKVTYAGPKGTTGEKIGSFIAMLESLTPGTYYFLDHPAYDTPEVRAVHHSGYTDVAADRQGVTELFTSPEVKEAIRRLSIELVSYADLVDGS